MGETLDSLLSGISSLGRLGTITLFATALALPRQSHAGEFRNETSAEQCQTSRECFEEGKNLCNLQDYTGAGRYFERALDLEDDTFRQVILLYNIGNVYERAGDPDRAITHFRFYLRQDIGALENEARRRGKEFTVPSAERVQEWIKGLEIYAAGKKAHTEGHHLEAVALYNQAIQTEISDTARLALRRDIALSYEMADQLKLASEYYETYLQTAGETSPDYVEIQGRVSKLRERMAPPHNLTTADSEPTTSPENGIEPSYLQRHLASTIAGSASVALLGASALLHFKAEGKREELEDVCGRTRAGCPAADIDALAGDYETRNALFWTGAAVAGAAAALFALEPFKFNSGGGKPQPSYTFTPLGTGAVLRGDF